MTTESDPLAHAIRELAAGRSLDAAAIADAFGRVMRGEGTPAQVAALLMALRVKGETPVEIAGVARALRTAMIPVAADDPSSLVDTCGTGGGGLTTFNISTAAALVAAGAGVRVAKHGNRSFTSRSGSADVLEALGVAIDTTPEVMARALADAGIVFMFAPLLHPAMKHVGPVRRELGIPTVMNIVGPLANPAGATRQVVGVADEARVPLIAGALAELGAERALVVHGAPGMDEVSPLGPTRVVEVRGASLTEWRIDPVALGLRDMRAGELAGGGPAENAAIIEAVLAGAGAPTARAAVLLNAAAAIYVSGRTDRFDEAYAIAEAALEAGAGRDALDRLRAAFGATV